MKIRLNEEYIKLLGRINISKCEYSQSHDEVNIELEKDIQYYKDQKRLWDKRLFKYNIAGMIIWGLSFLITKSFFEKEELLNVMLIELAIISFIGLILFLKKLSYSRMLKKLNKVQINKLKQDNSLIGGIVSLNTNIDKVIICIITINEHFYELSSITDEKELIKKFDIYAKEVIGAINLKYNFSATYAVYQDLYKEYVEYFSNIIG